MFKKDNDGQWDYISLQGTDLCLQVHIFKFVQLLLYLNSKR